MTAAPGRSVSAASNRAVQPVGVIASRGEQSRRECRRHDRFAAGIRAESGEPVTQLEGRDHPGGHDSVHAGAVLRIRTADRSSPSVGAVSGPHGRRLVAVELGQIVRGHQ